MFICVCNAITERQVQAAVSAGATSLSDLQGELGVASCCGRCADTATEYLPGGRYAEQSLHASVSMVGGVITEITEITELNRLDVAANDESVQVNAMQVKMVTRRRAFA